MPQHTDQHYSTYYPFCHFLNSSKPIKRSKWRPVPVWMYRSPACCCCFCLMREYCFFSALMSVLMRSSIMLLMAAWCSARPAPTAPGLSSAMLLPWELWSALWSAGQMKTQRKHPKWKRKNIWDTFYWVTWVMAASAPFQTFHLFSCTGTEGCN